MGGEVDRTVGQAFEPCRVLQLPVLATALDLTAGQPSAPGALVQGAIQAQGQLQQRALQVQLQLLLADVALASQGQATELGIAGLDATALEFDASLLRPIEAGIELEALQAVVGKGQLLPVQLRLALGRRERPGQVDPAIELAAQLRPELAQARQADVQLAADLLLQAARAIDPVIPQANVQGIEAPLLAGAVGLGLQQRGLAPQAALEIQVGGELELLGLQLPLATQGSGKGSG